MNIISAQMVSEALHRSERWAPISPEMASDIARGLNSILTERKLTIASSIRNQQDQLPVDTCPLCNGVGKVEDPQHGHSMHCFKCNGIGVLREGE